VKRQPSTIPQAIHGPNGGTPLGSAFVIADQAIEAACLAGDLDERFFVMVLTDGDPNCGTDMELVEQIARKWRNRGIGTYVFGLPGSEDGHETLDRLSRAGGTSTILVPGSPEALETDMAEIM
jgi:Mg-chelatase subunit ChlD